MQKIDPQDPRKPNEQIAASIRAAILTGELEPGQRLPPGTELADYFDVTRATVANAIRRLADEGFVRTRSGASVYVRDQADLPWTGDDPHPLGGMATFLFEMRHMANIPRTGWLLLGIPAPESVAEHSFGVAMTAMLLAALDGADVGRTVALACFHDAHETRVSDVPSVGRAYISTAEPAKVTDDQTAAMPEKVAAVVRDLTDEYEANQTREARLAHDADKLDTLVAAACYRQQGHDTDPWRETSVNALRTDAGKQLAQAIQAADPRWWKPFADSYAELRRTSRAKRSNDERGSRP